MKGQQMPMEHSNQPPNSYNSLLTKHQEPLTDGFTKAPAEREWGAVGAGPLSAPGAGPPAACGSAASAGLGPRGVHTKWSYGHRQDDLTLHSSAA